MSSARRCAVMESIAGPSPSYTMLALLLLLMMIKSAALKSAIECRHKIKRRKLIVKFYSS